MSIGELGNIHNYNKNEIDKGDLRKLTKETLQDKLKEHENKLLDIINNKKRKNENYNEEKQLLNDIEKSITAFDRWHMCKLIRKLDTRHATYILQNKSNMNNDKNEYEQCKYARITNSKNIIYNQIKEL